MAKYCCLLLLLLPFLLCFIQAPSSKEEPWLAQGNNYVRVIQDTCVYDNNNHAAFTALESFKGSLYLAFREGNAHVAEDGENIVIKVLKNTDGIWSLEHTFQINGTDLRDPFFLKWNNRLFMYAVGYYSELTDTGWTPLTKIIHNAPHYLNIWKMREYNGVLYGIGNANKKWPILLTSSDGINWAVKKEFELGGNATEADLCFIKNNVYICFRIEEPLGSKSLFGTGTYPFDDIKWNVMSVSVASPELMPISKNRMLLAGREYDLYKINGGRGIFMTVFTLNNKGEVLGKIRHNEFQYGDKGYPSFCRFGEKYYLSYYTGRKHTQVHLLKFEL